MTTLFTGRIDSPVGRLVFFCNDASIIRLLLPNGNEMAAQRELERLLGPIRLCGANRVTEQAACELQDYFAGRLRRFSVSATFLWGSAFSRSVWQGVMRIPYGQTVSYEALAQGCGVQGTRAVGNAVGKNPIPILVPCHRVVRKNGELGGFGGTPALKRRLLRLEGTSLACLYPSTKTAEKRSEKGSVA